MAKQKQKQMPRPNSWRIKEPGDNRNLVVVGCGGTGSYVAENLCRLFIDKPALKIILVDADIIEERNCRRQNFNAGEVGMLKCQALAERLSRVYVRELGWVPAPFREDLVLDMGGGFGHPLEQDIIIGCVDDSNGGRQAIHKMFDKRGGFGWWIDAGNGENSGQILIGNTQSEYMFGAFGGPVVGSIAAKDFVKGNMGAVGSYGLLNRLPLPTIQQPALLLAPPKKKKKVDCAAAVDDGGQSRAINQVMASLVTACVEKLYKGTLDWMGLYIDLSACTMSHVSATPEAVAAVTGLKAEELIERGKR
jgi:hypothetical protein